jgi:SsrA-binding protein
MKMIQQNRHATYDYEVISKLEVGIMFESYEVKQVTQHKCNIKTSFAKIINNEVFLFDMHIPKYENAAFYVKLEETRSRKLLLHKKEMNKLKQELAKNQGYTLIPLSIYVNQKGLVKLELGLCKGKKDYDKRQSIKERDIKRGPL